MKKWTACAIFWLMVSQLPGQLRPADDDWLAYDLSWGYWTDAPDFINFNLRSNNHTLSLLGSKYLFGPFHLGYGASFTSENYHTNLRIESDPNSPAELYSIIDPAAEFDYNKITAKYFEIPVELRLQSEANKSSRFWRLALGFKGGVRFRGYSVFKDDNVKVRYAKISNLHRFRAGTYARVGFGWFNLYGYYSFTGLFDGGSVNGFDLSNTQALSFGISITP